MNLAKHLPQYTVEDYMLWEGDWELIKGIPFAMAPSPLGSHQAIVVEISRQISNQVIGCKNRCYVYVELDWIIDEHTVLRPDVLVICKKIKEYLKETPEVVIEVVSKSTASKDDHLKFELYRDEKVKYYVLVYPALKKVRIFELKDDKYVRVFDGDSGSFSFKLRKDCSFSLDLEKLWEMI